MSCRANFALAQEVSLKWIGIRNGSYAGARKRVVNVRKRNKTKVYLRLLPVILHSRWSVGESGLHSFSMPFWAALGSGIDNVIGR